MNPESNLRVSVIMNIRDGEVYLRDALDSVMAQTFADWELVVWDDGSVDGSAAIVREYDDPRIRYFLSPQPNGLGRARQSAVEQARGEWLAFIDQDDVWLPEKLAKQVAIIEQHPDEKLGIVYGRTLSVNPNGAQWDFDSCHEFKPLPQGDIFTELLRKSCFINMSSAMLLRSAFFGVGGIPHEFQLTCDYYLFVAIARQYRARAVDDVVCYYRIHGDSLSHQHWEPMVEEGFVVLDRWAPLVDPRLMAESRHFQHTFVCAGDLRSPATFVRGVGRTVRHGCLSYILSRPAVHAYRALRRQFSPPEWMRKPRLSIGEIPRALPAEEQTSIKLSVIVVNWNVRELLRDSLHSLYREMRLPAEEWELIVVDNDSSDGSAEMVRREFPLAVLLANSENVGFAKGNNQAFELARGRYLLLLNPDTVVVEDAVGRMLAIMESDRKIGVLGCRLMNPDGTIQRWTAGSSPTVKNVVCHFLFLYRFLPQWMLPPPVFMEEEPSAATTVGWVSGACMLIRRECLASQLFDERFFMYGEDMELCRRLIARQWKIVYAPETSIVHYGGRSTDAQAPEVQLKRLQSLRDVFLIRNGKRWVWCFDLAAFVGFFVRSLAFAAAARLRPGKGFEHRATRSRMLLGDAMRTLIRG